MFSLITKIEDLVCKDTKSSNCLFSFLYCELNNTSNINKIQFKAKNELFQTVSFGIAPKLLKTQICTLQKRLIRILNHFNSLTLSCQHNSNCQFLIHKSLMDILYNLLEFLEHQFTKFFDSKAIAPQFYVCRKKTHDFGTS